VIASQTTVTMDEWYNYNYRANLVYRSEFRQNILQYLTNTGQNLSVIDGFGALDITTVLNQHVEPPKSSYSTEIKHWDKIEQLERVFHATRDVVPNSWKTNNYDLGLLSLEGRYWIANVLLGISCIGSVSLYASVSISAKKEKEQDAEKKAKQQAVVDAVFDALNKWRPSQKQDKETQTCEKYGAGARSDAGQQRGKETQPCNKYLAGASSDAGQQEGEDEKMQDKNNDKNIQTCDKYDAGQRKGNDAQQCDKYCFWEHVPSCLDVSIALMVLSLMGGISFAVWGVLDVGISRFPNGLSIILTYDFWLVIWGSVLLVFYALSSILAFLDGNKESVWQRCRGRQDCCLDEGAY